MTYIQDGPHCDRKGTKQCQSSPMSSIPCAPSWVSNTLSDIWCSSTVTVCIDTSIQKWSFWTSRPWASAYRYVVKIEQKLKQKTWQFGSVNPSQQKQGKGGPNPQNKGHRKDGKPQDNHLSPKQRRTMGRQIKTLGSGVSSIRAPGITSLNFAQSSHWWLR
jgi:hypothetical protein